MVATSPSCGGSDAADPEGTATGPERITPPLYIGAKKKSKKMRKNLQYQNKTLYLQCLNKMCGKKSRRESGIFFAIVLQIITTSGAVIEKSRNACTFGVDTPPSGFLLNV